MKKYSVFIVFCLAALFSAAAVFAQQGSGFTGPSAPTAVSGQTGYQAMTVSQLQSLPNKKTIVTLTGNITQSAGRNNYTFRDAGGEITIKIDRHYWWDLTVGPSDRVQLLVEVEKKRNGRLEVEAKALRKL